MDEFDITIPEFSTLDIPLMNFSRVEVEWQRLWQNVPEPWKLSNNGLEFTVGEKIAAKGLSAKYPIVLIPGIISTVRLVVNLSPWIEKPCFCRDRVWSLGPLLTSTDLFSARSFGVASL